MSNDYESIIVETGWGLCHHCIVGLCSICAFSEAYAFNIIVAVVPLLACDLKLSASQATALHATLTFGMAVGAFLFGIIIDINGRKGPIPITMIITFCASISLSFAQTVLLIHLSMFILGLGLAGNNVVLRVYLAELLPIKRRGICLVLLDLLGILGHISALGLSWLLIPSIIELQTKKFRPISWRVFVVLGGFPNFIIACIVSVLPESPRFLFFRRRQEEALTVLQQIYAINNSRHADTYRGNNIDNCIQPDEEDEDDRSSLLNKTRRICKKACRRVRMLYEPPFRRITSLGICTSFLEFPGIGWFALWNGRILQEIKTINDSVKNYSTCIIDIQNMALEFLRECEEVNADRFKLLLCLSMSYVFGGILLLIGIDIIGRKPFLVSAGLIGATASLILLFTVHSSVHVILLIIILATYAIGRTSYTILLLENYSTGLRGTIIGLTRILPYCFASCVILFLNTYCFSSIIFVSGLLLCTALAAVRIPDLTRSPMRE